MNVTSLQNILLIANPASQNGNGAKAAEVAAKSLRTIIGEDNLDIIFTTKPNHACDIARNASGYSCVIALGGDGAIHEVVNGLMQKPFDDRPTLGIIPVGSGNDYAKALNIPANIEKACSIIKNSSSKLVDIGRVNDRFFTETLSFGLDAAIALDTMERRKKTNRKGALLYMESGFNQLINHLDTFDYTLSIDGGKPIDGQSIVFAVQIGPYYGGGFKICPDAKVDDGHFEICIAHPPIGMIRAIAVFLKAKNGNHTNVKQMEFLRAKTLTVEFSQKPPAQFDGEEIIATKFDVEIIPQALRVIHP